MHGPRHAIATQPKRSARAGRSRGLATAGLILFCLSAVSYAHEVRPALLRITQHADHRVDVLWRQPSDGALAIHLEPQVSGGLLDPPPDATDVLPDAQSRLWRDLDPGPAGLDNRVIHVDGLEHTLLDTLVFVQLADGTTRREILNARAPTATLHLESRPGGVADYLLLGMRHILSGPDHLLFVLALVLIVRNRWALLKTITAFTLAHSLTLAASALGALQFSPTLIDTLIALSILFVAPDVIRVARGDSTPMRRRPWLIAFCFGLLHGLGFATGLSTAGLTHTELLQALILFNVGVELGQLAFIALVLGAIWLLRRLPIAWPRPVLLAPAYVIGSMAAFWVIDNGLRLFSAG